MTYDVLLTKKDEKFIARVRQWPEIIVEGDTEETVLAQARADLKALLTSGRVVQLDLEIEPDEHPWLKFAGVFAEDPDWDLFQASIQQYRTELDQTLSEV